MKLLWIDDDLYSIIHAIECLKDKVHIVETVIGVKEALLILKKTISI